jgi:hypothetical protein
LNPFYPFIQQTAPLSATRLLLSQTFEPLSFRRGFGPVTVVTVVPVQSKEVL